MRQKAFLKRSPLTFEQANAYFGNNFYDVNHLGEKLTSRWKELGYITEDTDLAKTHVPPSEIKFLQSLLDRDSVWLDDLQKATGDQNIRNAFILEPIKKISPKAAAIAEAILSTFSPIDIPPAPTIAKIDDQDGSKMNEITRKGELAQKNLEGSALKTVKPVLTSGDVAHLNSRLFFLNSELDRVDLQQDDLSKNRHLSFDQATHTSLDDLRKKLENEKSLITQRLFSDPCGLNPKALPPFSIKNNKIVTAARPQSILPTSDQILTTIPRILSPIVGAPIPLSSKPPPSTFSLNFSVNIDPFTDFATSRRTPSS